MKLQGKDTSFEINIVNYQFPKAREEYDSNWLVMRIKVRDKEKSWQVTDACLLTWEIKWLCKWFKKIINNEEGKELIFMEPNLRFIKSKKTDKNICIRVYFELEARPKWAYSNIVGEEDLWIDLMPSKSELNSAINDLRAQLKKFPERGKPKTL